MKTIWKFELELRTIQHVIMPPGALILTAQMQKDKLCIWALVDPEEIPEVRKLYVYGTGHPIDDKLDRMFHVATVQDGVYVWHVFESTSTPTNEDHHRRQ